MLCVDYLGTTPQRKPGSLAAPTATAIGHVILEPGSALWYGAVLRGDINTITVGENSNIQDNAVLHVEYTHPLTIGAGVTVGHGAILHGCRVEEDCLIGMGAILMNGCVIGRGSLVAAGTLIPENAIIPPGSLVVGSPGKVKRPLTPEELASIPESARRYLERAKEELEGV